jgi:hypothetical protein
MQNELSSRQASWSETLAGAILLLLPSLLLNGFSFLSAPFGLDFSALPIETIGRLVGWIFLLVNLLCILALLAGWTRDWPRWVFPYAGALLIFSALLSFSATPGLILFGHQFGSDEIWGWRAWIPWGIFLAAGLLLTRSLQPLQRLFQVLRQDWTRLSFALYGLLPISLFILFDEVHGSELFFFISGILLAVGAAAYLRDCRSLRRFLWLAAASVLVTGGAAVFLGLYWSGRQETWMRSPANGWDEALSAFISGIFLLVILAFPGLAAGAISLGKGLFRRMKAS